MPLRSRLRSLFLSKESKSGQLAYKPKLIPTRATGKGRQLHDAEFEKERSWLLSFLKKNNNQAASSGITHADDDNDDDDDGECESGIECGCCFSTFAFVSVQHVQTLFMLIICKG